jgi:hypothetical protein
MTRRLMLLAALFSAGCAYRTPIVHVPAVVPSYSRVTLDASDVIVVDGKGDAVDPKEAADVRAEVGKILSNAGQGRGEPGATQAHARVVIGRTLDLWNCGRVDGMGCLPFVPYLMFGLVGADTEETSLSVDLTLESPGRTFVGHGEADK